MTQEVLSELGNRIREIRISQKMTQQELAEKSDLSLPFVNLIENNKRNISLETLVKLLSTLNVSMSDFFLPFSQEDKNVENLLLLLQKSDKKEKFVELFTQIILLSKE